MFEYNQQESLDIQEHAVWKRNNVDVHDVSYTSPRGGRVPAYLVVPHGVGPFAGMLYMHPGGADREAFLDEAVLFAEAGAVALLIDAPDVRPPGQSLISFSEQDREVFIQGVVDLRRGVDVLTSRPDVDSNRLGYVGFSYGATLGAMLTASEDRIKAYVIMSGSARLTYYLRQMGQSVPEQQLERYLESMAVLDLIHHVGNAAPAKLFFQNGRLEEMFPEEEMLMLHEAASEPKLIKWYDAGHGLNAEACRDRTEWLGEQLGLNVTPLLLERLEQLEW